MKATLAAKQLFFNLRMSPTWGRGVNKSWMNHVQVADDGESGGGGESQLQEISNKRLIGPIMQEMRLMVNNLLRFTARYILIS